MLKEVDCRGLDCPKPVIMTKAALEEMTDGVLVTLVDNSIAKENVLKLASGLNLHTEVRENQGEYQISIEKTGSHPYPNLDEMTMPQESFAGEYVILLKSSTLGTGSKDLGKVLMKSLLFTAASHSKAPKAIMLLNSGVELACFGSDVLESLETLYNKGVDVVSCGTCLDFFNLTPHLAVGRIGNMYDIYEQATRYRLVSL